MEQLCSGFFLLRQAGKETIVVPHGAAGGANELQPAEAAAAYIKVLRNATHGHGSKHKATKERTDVLLAHHDGTLPHDLALLGYLYLLDLLTHADDLRHRLYRGGGT